MMRYLLLVLALALPGWAWEISYAATTAGASTWNRPVESLAGPSGVGTAVPYHVSSFVAPVTGVYTLHSVATGGWDNFLVLYQGAFAPGSPLTNAVAANDDWPTFGIIGQSRIVRTLTAGLTYNLVTTGYFNSSMGTFTNTISTPTPEPATWMMIAFGVCVLMMRRKLSPDRASPQSPAPPAR